MSLVGRWVVVGALLVAALGFGALAFSRRAAAQVTQLPGTPPPPDVVYPHDLLVVGVWDAKPNGGEMLKTVRVDGEGHVSLFFVGQVKVAGMTFEQAEAAINGAYQNGNVVQNAAPSINRLEKGNAPSIPSGPINVGDRVSFRIYELVDGGEETRILTVSDGGAVGLPLLGQFKVFGLTEAAAEQAIAQAYADRFNLHPAVSALRLSPRQATEPTTDATPTVHLSGRAR